jgi:biopolymer transport protein ExbD
MADTNPNQRPVSFVDEDAKFDWLKRKAKKKYKSQQRKFRRDAESESGELNLTAMMDMMTILLVFLIKSYGAADISVAMGEDLTPPTSRSTLQPQPAVTITITKKDIAVGEKGIVKLLENGQKLPAEALDGLLITAVKDALDVEVDKLNRLAEYNPTMRAKLGTDKDPTKMLIVVGDKDMPYAVLFSVLGTAGQSGLKYFKFLAVSASD